MTKHIVVIGSGLGGLECGYILARHGFKVTVVEKHGHVGGCLQTFKRNGHQFDCGFHYVGGLDEGQSLYPIFKYLGLLDLPWKRLGPECSDEVVLGGRSFYLPSGHELFEERLSEQFPDSRKDIHEYVSFLRKIGDNIFNVFKGEENVLFAKSAYSWLCETIHDPLLRRVLSGSSLKMELQEETLPLYTFAQINESFMQSSWRLTGGGSQIAERLSASIRSMGGDVLTMAEVVSIDSSGDFATGVVLADGRRIDADIVVSDAAPSVTMDLLEGSSVRKIYRKRLSGLPQTYGMFTANISLKKGSMPYLNRNVFIHSEDAGLWHPSTRCTESVLVHFYPEGDALDLMSPMSYEDLLPWADAPVGRRGEEYSERKRAKAEEVLDLTSVRFPELRASVEDIWTSTPLTWQSYTGTTSGSAYGVRKDWRNPLGTVISSETPLKNLFLTGQSLNVHGILGVSMTALMTCAKITDISDVFADFY